MRKILIVNKYYSPDVGGVETVVKQHAQILNDDYLVQVICVNKHFSFFSKNETIDGVNVLRCSSLGTFFSMPLSFSFFIHYINGYLKSNLTINHCPFPLMDVAFFFARLIRSKKTILFWHSDIVKQRFFKKLLMPFINSTLQNSTKILTTSPNLVDHSCDLRLYKNKCHVLPLFIDSNKVTRLVSKELYDKKYDFIFFGRLCYYKGVEVLMDAINLLNKKEWQPKILIAGEGELADYISEKISSYKLNNVTYINRFLSEQEKYDALSASKCFLFPSVANSEAFGITQLEAMALGVPVINTNLKTGVPYVSVDGVTGITVEVNDPHALANAMVNILSDNDRLQCLSKNCTVRMAELFEQTVVADKFKKVVNEIL